MSASPHKAKSFGSQSMLESGVAGLDVVLGGGLPAGGLYLIQGLAGSGKTTLACQIGFSHARQGKKVLVLTLLGESHAKMINHFANFSFFDDALIGKELVFFSAYTSIKKGLRELLHLIVETMVEEKPHILIIDGFRSIRNGNATDLALTEFMHSLNSLVSSMGCTTFLLSPVEGNVTDNENTLVDGVIELGQYRQGMGVIRELQIFKIRGAKHLLGKHVFEVRDDGVVVYPRFEAIAASAKAPPADAGRRSVGIPSWDERIGGGVVAGSITCLLGSPGVGKTLMGLHFIGEGLKHGENCLIVGFHESPETIVQKAHRIGIELQPHVASGKLQLMWQLPLEILIDDLASRMLACIREHKVSRLLIDGVEGLANLIMHPERSRSFLVALTNHLRMHGVTVYMTEQLHYFRRLAPAAEPSSSSLYENIMLLEYFTVGDINHRQVSVMKLRENEYDGANRLMTISREGMVVGDVSSSISGKRPNADCDVA
ncbi:ATPase domain-containing protein [Massilia sp. CMS3.1]|uniref:ATPase domain-containing protein n=1 Tax=Massilia sp. CMS3.1 TaxID=3373083 RepID=UPI003EE58E73